MKERRSKERWKDGRMDGRMEGRKDRRRRWPALSRTRLPNLDSPA
jgi:hypothetical protein